MKRFFVLIIAFAMAFSVSNLSAQSILSPDGDLKFTFKLNEGVPTYSVSISRHPLFWIAV